MKKKIKFDLARYEQGNCEVIDEIGNKVRIFATDFKRYGARLIIGAITLTDDFEIDKLWYRDGTEVERNNKHSLCLLVDVPCELKPFDKVLVRDGDEEKWERQFFDAYFEVDYPYRCIDGECYSQCIPYEGNEELADTSAAPKLAGTTNAPKSDGHLPCNENIL